MADIQTHEAQDRILKFLIEKTGHTHNNYITSDYIAKELFPGTHKEVVFVILKKMMHTADPIFTTVVRSDEINTFNVLFKANALSQILLDQGGFTAEFHKKQDAEKKRERSEALDEEIRENSLLLNKDTIRLNKLNKIFLVINALIALFTLAWTIFKG
jgi:hypothetical protein